MANENETRPAQTEQQPVAVVPEGVTKVLNALIAVRVFLSVYRSMTPEIHALFETLEENICAVNGTLAAPIAQTEQPTPWQEATGRAAFKSFHRRLCERFGYTHDEEFWWRDLVSLEEHIAKQTEQPEQSGLAVPSLTEQEMDDLREFHQAVCCDAGHRVEKEGMRRLAEIGVVESVGFGKHRLTEFGTYWLAALSLQGGE